MSETLKGSLLFDDRALCRCDGSLSVGVWEIVNIGITYTQQARARNDTENINGQSKLDFY